MTGILATSALSPARAQAVDDVAVEQVLRASGMARNSQAAVAAECGWLYDPRATDRTISGVPANARKGSEKTEAALLSNVWKLYHRLGDAHAAAGNTQLAIRCYEKSVVLNPENDAGFASLMRLQNQDALRRSSPHPEH